MDLDKMTIAEVEVLLRLLAEWERDELELVIWEQSTGMGAKALQRLTID